MHLFGRVFLLMAVVVCRGVAQCPTVSGSGVQWVAGTFGIAGTEVGTQCTGRAVVVTAPATVANARYIYDYKTLADTAKATTATSHSYNTPGSYYIVQLGNVNGRPSMACGLVQVFATSKPTFEISAGCQATVQVKIDTRGQIYGRYLIDYGDGRPPQVYLPGQPTPVYTYATSGSYPIKVTGEGINALRGCGAVSDVQVFRSLAAPTPIANAAVTLLDNQYPRVTVVLDDTARRVKNYVFVKSGTELVRSRPVWTDSTVAQKQICYQATYSDVCDRRAALSPTLCTIYAENDGGQLRWSGESPFVRPVVRYVVDKIGAEGRVLASYEVGKATSWPPDVNDPDQTVSYRVRAVSDSGLVSVSNVVRFVRTTLLYVPDAFSPNNDQINDLFELKGQFINSGQLTVYDRWGEVVYYSNDWRKGWDGTDKFGKAIGGGIYGYRVDYIDLKNNAYVKTGNVHIIR